MTPHGEERARRARVSNHGAQNASGAARKSGLPDLRIQ